MFARTTFALMVLGYCVCVSVALLDRQYFQGCMFFLVATLHALSRFEKRKPELLNNAGLPRLIQLTILSMGLAVVLYLALRKP